MGQMAFHDGSTSGRPPRRHPGWAARVGVLGIAFLLIGLVLVLMIQAPGVRHRVVVTGWVLIAAGALLLPVAWLGRSKPEHRN